MRTAYLLTAVLIALPAFAQKYELGLHGGISLYDKKTVTNPRGNADAGFNTGYVAGVTLGQNMYNLVGGEIRYTYFNNEMKLESGGSKATFGAQAHAIHYDFLLHGTGVDSAVRPYVAVGGGVKIFQGTGTEQAFQPLNTVALLTKTTDTKGLLSFGGGVKARIGKKSWLRLDVHDYMTPFPKNVITPAANSTVSGWLNNIVVSGGIAFTF